MRIHTHTHARERAHTHTHARTHAHTHTHTHTLFLRNHNISTAQFKQYGPGLNPAGQRRNVTRGVLTAIADRSDPSVRATSCSPAPCLWDQPALRPLPPPPGHQRTDRPRGVDLSCRRSAHLQAWLLAPKKPLTSTKSPPPRAPAPSGQSVQRSRHYIT